MKNAYSLMGIGNVGVVEPVSFSLVATTIAKAAPIISKALAVFGREDTHQLQFETIDGLSYASYIPKKEGLARVIVLVDGLNIIRKIAFGLDVTSRIQKDPQSAVNIKLPVEIINSVLAKGKDPNKIDWFIFSTPDGYTYAIRGNQIYSNNPSLQQAQSGSAVPGVSKAGFNIITGLFLVSLVGGIIYYGFKSTNKK